jgi:SAM-dependent methyltransferase
MQSVNHDDNPKASEMGAQILNPRFLEEMLGQSAIKLDLGSGGKRKAGFFAVDHLPLDGVDVVANLNEPLDFLPDNSVDYVHTRHVLEHITNFMALMAEIHRVVKPGGVIEVIVPHFSNVYGYSDPTHVRFFGLYTFHYFVAPDKQPALRRVPAFYTDARFLIDSIRIDFYERGFIDRALNPLLSRLVNRSLAWQDFYERRLARLLHAWQVRYVLRVDKPMAGESV